MSLEFEKSPLDKSADFRVRLNALPVQIVFDVVSCTVLSYVYAPRTVWYVIGHHFLHNYPLCLLYLGRNACVNSYFIMEYMSMHVGTYYVFLKKYLGHRCVAFDAFLFSFDIAMYYA